MSQRARDPLLERLHELLLAHDAVEVGVGVAEADEVERVLARPGSGSPGLRSIFA